MNNFLNSRNKYGKIIYIIFIPLMVIFLEVLSFLSLESGLKFLVFEPVNFLINLLIFASIFFIINALSNRIRITMAISTILILVLGIATKLKSDFRGANVGFSISDLFLLGEASDMSSALSQDFIIRVAIFAIIFLIVSAFLIYMAKTKPFKIKMRLIPGFLGIIFLGTFMYFGSIIQLSYVNVQQDGITYVGSFQYFLLNSSTDNSLPPATSKEISDLESTYSKDIVFKGVKGIKPDVLVIQSESYFDPTTIGLNQFSEDPMPFFHSLEKTNFNFNVSTPLYGGGTSNSEMESVTGLPSRTFPNDIVPWKSNVTTTTISTGSILGANGYTSDLLHPFQPMYYNRNNVYKYLGFNRFYSLYDLINYDPSFDSKAFEDSEYPNDEELFKEEESITSKSSTPNFTFMITMQNHAPYKDSTYNGYNVHYTGNKVSNKASLDSFNIYLKGLKKSDDALKSLINNIKISKKPTIVVFYGDHRTPMNQDAEMYSTLGINDNTKGPNYLEYSSKQTPGIIWSNYLDTKTIFKDSPKVEPIFNIPIDLFSLIDVKIPNYFKVLNGITNGDGNINALSYNYLVKNNKFISTSDPEYIKTMTAYKQVVSDMLSTNKFLEENPNEFYNPKKYIYPTNIRPDSENPF